MTATVVLVWGLVGTRIPAMRVAAAAGLVSLVARVPLVAVAGGVAGVAVATHRKVRLRTRRSAQVRHDVAVLAELTALGLTGGLGAQAALSLAASVLDGSVAEEAKTVLRRMRVDGTASVVAATGHGQGLYRVIARSAVTGAPLLDQVSRLAGELHEDLASARLEAERRLPIAMLFPLTLLILPGFLLLTVTPALLDAFGRLQI